MFCKSSKRKYFFFYSIILKNGNQYELIILKKGFHKIKVAYYDGSGGNELTATMQLENAEKNTLTSKLIWIKK